jgi:hypothetical protein
MEEDLIDLAVFNRELETRGWRLADQICFADERLAKNAYVRKMREKCAPEDLAHASIYTMLVF